MLLGTNLSKLINEIGDLNGEMRCGNIGHAPIGNSRASCQASIRRADDWTYSWFGGGPVRSIIILFEDQMSLENPVFKVANLRRDIVVLVDSAEKTDQRAHRKRFRTKAMDAFADDLGNLGWQTHIISVDRREGRGALGRALKWCANDVDTHHLIAAEPSDAAMRTSLERLAPRFRKTVRILNDLRFICSRQEFADMRSVNSSGMEFYQSLRRREALLMDGDEPEGGRWRHIDGNGRADLTLRTPDVEFERPAPTVFQANRDLERFIEFTLPRLSACEYLDPALPHSLPCPEIELMLDAGLLNPLSICHRIDRAFREGKVPLYAAEHAIYRIVGLREFRRGLMRLGEIPADSDPDPDQVMVFREAHERREAGLAAQRRIYKASSDHHPITPKQKVTAPISYTRRIALSASMALRGGLLNII